MAEYAIKKSDGKEVWIGRCSTINIRYEDRDKFIQVSGNIDLSIDYTNIFVFNNSTKIKNE